MSDSRVVVVGDGLVDEIYDEGATAASSRHVGGAALNVAVGLAVLGLDTELIAMVGDDEDGAWIGRYLGEHGVRLIASPAPHGSALAASRRVNGEPTYEFNRAAWERRITTGPAEQTALAAASHVVVSCFPLDDHEQTASLLAAVPDRGRKLIVDPNPRAGMMHDLGRFVESIAEIARDCRLIKIGDDDAAMLYGRPVADVAAELLALGAGAVLTTSGPDGAALYTASGETFTAGIVDLPGPIVDTMGAGDATLAAVTQAIFDADRMTFPVQWDAALRWAMGIAAATCRAPGALLRVP